MPLLLFSSLNSILVKMMVGSKNYISFHQYYNYIIFFNLKTHGVIDMRKKNRTIIETILIFVVLCSSIQTMGLHVTELDQNKVGSDVQLSAVTIPSIPYTGRLRIYLVEPKSRWDNDDRDPFHFGFLDFALDEEISIDYLDTYTKNVSWSAKAAGFQNVQKSNIMAIATVFTSDGHKGYADPPMDNPFDAYYVDASAGAVPGYRGENKVTANFTHTVFVEEAVAPWCQYCPVTSEKLFDVYESKVYPFYFVALVADVENPSADQRVFQDYNLYGFPTTFFDGGYRVLVGGYDNESYYQAKIQQCGTRDVHALNLSLAVTWLGEGNLTVEVTIINKEEIINTPPAVPTIDGASRIRSGKEYTCNISTIDPEDNDIFYLINWGDDVEDIEIGPYHSGEAVQVNHTWNKKETYVVQVKAKDVYGAESDWATLEVRMPKMPLFNVVQMVHRNPWLITPLTLVFRQFEKNTRSTDDIEYWGLLIAVGEYLNNPNENRPSMLTEVENVYAALVNADNWEPSHIMKMKAENADLDGILEGFSWLRQMEDDNDFSFIYITTHGYFLNIDLPPIDEADGKDEILIPYEGFDDTSKFLWDDEINFFCSLLDSIGVCLIVDSCFSGGFKDAYVQIQGELPSEHWIDELRADLAAEAGRVILMSCKENEVSYGSTFSYYVAQGINGAADDNNDGIITAEEIFWYAEPFVTRYGAQHPTLIDAYSGELPVILTLH